MEPNHLLTPDVNLAKMKDQNENIQVFVRVRPINNMERAKNSLLVLDCPGNKEVVVRDRTVNNITKTFTFDRVFGPLSKQVDVYKTVVAPLLEEVLLGYNCTVFAYGQTGTGKTFTMEGERSNDPKLTWENDPLTGIVPRALSQLFDELRLQNVEFTVRVSLLELYNEELFDLLSPNDDNKLRTLRLFEDTNRKGSVIIQGLEEVTVHNKHEVYHIMERGTEKRQTAATQMNASSSRSHTVFTVTVHIKESNMDGEELLKIGKLHLVDLAGSENIGRSGAVDKRAREAGSINQSLLTLGRVITALVERAPHIPYRESKLTRLLQDSLGGRTKTSIIATVSPASYNLEETLSTLDYAHRAKNIMNRPEINQKLTKKAMLKAYTEEIERLRRDLIATREKNGVYMDKENYDYMTSQLDSQGQDLCEKITQVRSLQESLDHKEEELKLVKAQWEETKDDLEVANQVLGETRCKVEKLQQLLIQTQLERDQQEHLVETHVKTEEQLSNQAAILLQTTEETTSTLDKLYRKLDRKKYIEQANLKSGETFKTDLTEQFNKICSKLESFRVDHASFCGQQRMKLDLFLQDKETQMATLTNLNTNFLKETKDLISKSDALVASELKSLESYVSDIGTGAERINTEGIQDLDKFMKHIVANGTKSVLGQLMDLQKSIETLGVGFKNDMERQKSLVNTYVIAHIRKLEENRKGLEVFFDQQIRNNQELESSVSSQQKLHDSYNKNFKAEAEAMILQMQKLLVNANEYTTVANEHNADIKNKISESTAEAVDFVNSMRSGFDIHKVEAEMLRTNSTDLEKEQCKKLDEGLEGSRRVCVSGAKSVDYVREQITSHVTEQKHRLSETRKLILTHTEQRHTQGKEFSTQYSGSSSAITKLAEERAALMGSGLNKLFDGDMTLVGDGKTEMETHCNHFTQWSEKTRGQIYQQNGKLNEYWESTYLVDLPTGMTPQKKSYDYPRTLSATSPHENIINRFTSRRQQAENNEIF